MINILVTGATGTIGSRLISALALRPDVRVRAAVRSSAKANALARGPAVTPVDFDWHKADSMRTAVESVDRVFLLTPLADDSVDCGKRLVEAAKAAGVKHVIKLSTSGADQEPGILLGRWHREVERHIERSGLAYTFLRPGSFMNNFITYFAPDKEGSFYLPLGEGASAYIDARDIADVAATVLTSEGHAGKIYTLTGPEALTASSAAAMMSEASGRTIRYIDVPEAAARTAMEGFGAPRWMIDGLLELYAIMKAGYTAGTTNTVREVTGRAPRTFKEFARDHASAWKLS